MLARVLAIALNTYRESVRARILLGLAGVAFAVALYATVVAAFTLNDAPRVVSDLGVASISIFAIVVAVLIGATSLHRELEQKTIFPILARPIRRGEYLVGKYLGTLLTIVVFVMADAGLVLLICAGIGGRPVGLVVGSGVASVVALGAAAIRWPSARTFGPIPWAAVMLLLGTVLSSAAPIERRVVLSGSLLVVLEVAIVAGIATLFASFSTPFLSALLTVLVTIVGRDADSLARLPVRYFGAAIHEAGFWLAKFIPNLQLFVPPRPLLAGEVADVHLSTYLVQACGCSLGWAVGLLAVSAFIFRKRDFL